MGAMLERMRRVLAGEDDGTAVPRIPPPIARLLGLELVAVDAGTARVTLDAAERHHNPVGTLHGGVLCDLADLAMGIALGTLFDGGEVFTTVELKMSFVRPVRTGLLQADARVVHRGRTLSLVECDVTGLEGKLVARASSTLIVVDDRGRQPG